MNTATAVTGEPFDNGPTGIDDHGVTVFLGPYELKGKLAQGGMAEVFLAIKRAPAGFERPVAIKQILPHLADEPEFVEMFLSEARLAATLSHPHIAATLDVQVEHGRYSIVMEYLSGRSLAQIAKKARTGGSPLPHPLAIYVVARAAEGLAHAHEKTGPDGQSLGIVHRDVSPQNILITFDGQVKVVDFGIARAADRIRRTMSGQLRGKIAYMSPEQSLGQPLDARSDVFSLGIVLWEQMTREFLFRGEGELATLEEVRSAPIPSLLDRPDIPRGVARIVEEALERDVGRRLRSAREMSGRLDQVLAQVRPALSSRPTAALAEYMQAVFDNERAKETALLNTPTSEPALSGAGHGPRAVTRQTRAADRAIRSAKGRTGIVALAVTVALLPLVAVWIARHTRDENPRPRAAQDHTPTTSVAAPPASSPPVRPPDPVSLPAMPSRAAVQPVRAKAQPVASRPPRRPIGPPPVAGKGTLTMDTVPWTNVYLGERRLGTTPLVKTEIPAGRHRLRLVNEEQGIERWYDVDVQSNQTLILPRIRF